jgi:hypothetical protein
MELFVVRSVEANQGPPAEQVNLNIKTYERSEQGEQSDPEAIINT